MYELDLDIEFSGDMLCGMLCAVYRSVLTSGTAVRHHQICEPAVDISLDGSIDQGMAVVEECNYFAIVLKEFYYVAVQSGEGLVAFVFSRIVDGAAVENETSAITGGIVRYTFLICETQYTDGKFAPCEFISELLEVHKTVQKVIEVWIFLVWFVKELAEVGDSEGDGLHEVGLLLEVAAEAVCAKHLKSAEENEMAESGEEFVASDGYVFVKRYEIFVKQVLS